MSDITSTDLSAVSYPAAYYITFIINTTHYTVFSLEDTYTPFSNHEQILDMKIIHPYIANKYYTTQNCSRTYSVFTVHYVNFPIDM